jgi:hypothetical protein
MKHHVHRAVQGSCALLTLAGTVIAADVNATANAVDAGSSDLNTTVILISLVAIGLLVYSYKLRIANLKLKEEVRRYRSKLAEFLQTVEAKYEPVKSTEGNKKPGEADVIERQESEGVRAQYTKRLYWDRLTSTINKTSEHEELAELESRKKDLEELIELTKKKYHMREIDEKSFSEIIKDHQKQMIEVEAKIGKLMKK